MSARKFDRNSSMMFGFMVPDYPVRKRQRADSAGSFRAQPSDSVPLSFAESQALVEQLDNETVRYLLAEAACNSASVAEIISQEVDANKLRPSQTRVTTFDDQVMTAMGCIRNCYGRKRVNKPVSNKINSKELDYDSKESDSDYFDSKVFDSDDFDELVGDATGMVESVVARIEERILYSSPFKAKINALFAFVKIGQLVIEAREEIGKSLKEWFSSDEWLEKATKVVISRMKAEERDRLRGEEGLALGESFRKLKNDGEEHGLFSDFGNSCQTYFMKQGIDS